MGALMSELCYDPCLNTSIFNQYTRHNIARECTRILSEKRNTKYQMITIHFTNEDIIDLKYQDVSIESHL